MLAVTSYPEVYVQLTTAKVDEQLAAYAALAAAVKGNAKAEAALAAFAPGYFNTMLRRTGASTASGSRPFHPASSTNFPLTRSK